MVKLVSLYVIFLKVAEPIEDVKWRLTYCTCSGSRVKWNLSYRWKPRGLLSLFTSINSTCFPLSWKRNVTFTASRHKFTKVFEVPTRRESVNSLSATLLWTLTHLHLVLWEGSGSQALAHLNGDPLFKHVGPPSLVNRLFHSHLSTGPRTGFFQVDVTPK